MKVFRIGCITVALIPVLTIAGANGPSAVKEAGREASQGHRSGMMARAVFLDGTERTLRLEGVGCSESICSRVFIRSTGEGGVPLRTWLDSIASIQHTAANDALLVMRDGAQRRVTFVPDFRVLYISTPGGRAERLDLTTIRSLEFLDSGK